MKLEKGDVIMTGTPKGVGQVLAGETITCDLSVNGKVLSHLTFPVIDRPNPRSQ
jgi:acylpyruvate hydrolase